VTTIERTTRSEAQTIALAAELAKHLRGGEIIALRGTLGAGKTCFVRGLAAGLGIRPGVVSSPTYVLCHEYESREKPLRLAHLDLYRAAGPEELEGIGWDELLESRDTVIAIEWPERIGKVMVGAERIVDVAIEHAGAASRRITIEARGDLAHRLECLPGAGGGERPSPAACPICGRGAPREAASYPFCSERCRLVDLGRWFAGSYTLSRPIEPDDEDEQE
jgi:tRNA threonylcarbamoyladenosine biosynthesis protein TsaE